MSVFSIVVVILVGYLLGAISFAVIVAWRHGVDILNVGSGNPGATNVKRMVGSGPGNIVFLLDCLKGFIAAGWPLVLFPDSTNSVFLGIVGFLASILGHSCSIFIKFKGGKGVAVTVGGLLALMPLALLIGAMIWVIVFYTTRYVSLASICLGFSLPLSAFLLRYREGLLVLSLFVAIVIGVRHRSNIVRLLKGTESKFNGKSRY